MTRKTNPWWVCSCGAKIARVGSGLSTVAWETHRKATGCKAGGSIVQVPQRPTVPPKKAS